MNSSGLGGLLCVLLSAFMWVSVSTSTSRETRALGGILLRKTPVQHRVRDCGSQCAVRHDTAASRLFGSAPFSWWHGVVETVFFHVGSFEAVSGHLPLSYGPGMAHSTWRTGCLHDSRPSEQEPAIVWFVHASC